MMVQNNIENPGCVVILIDESAAMDSPIQEVSSGSLVGQVPKSKANSISAALNAMLKRLGAGPDFDVAILAYKTDGQDKPVVKSCWGGALAGRDFVSVREITDNPIRIDTRTRKRPNPTGFGAPIEESVSFPVWIELTPHGKSAQVAGFQRCKEVLSQWLSTAGRNPGIPLVLHLFAAGSADGNPQKAIEGIINSEVAAGKTLLLQSHLSTSKTVPTTPYPSNRYYLPVGPQKDLFPRCSVLPDHLAAPLKASKQQYIINAGAVGMLYNAKMIDVDGFLRLIETHTSTWPSRQATADSSDDLILPDPLPVSAAAPIAPESDSAPMPIPVLDAEPLPETILEIEDDTSLPVELERAALLVFILDRSLADPFSGDVRNPCARLQEHLNDFLGKLGKRPTSVIDIGVLSYGLDSVGEIEIRQGLDGTLCGKELIRDSELMEGAIRVDELEQQVPNGIGGLMTITVKKPVFVELEPTSAASPISVFIAANKIINDWCSTHSATRVPPVIVHLTRGQFIDSEIADAAAQLNATQSITLAHLVVTEAPHRSVLYASDSAELEDAGLKLLHDLSSSVLNEKRLVSEKPAVIKAGSKGLVVNGKMDLLLESVLQMLDT